MAEHSAPHRLDAALAALVEELDQVTREWERVLILVAEAQAARERLRTAILELERAT
jgi:hypothetical protein